ncbi:universal stress protein [Alkalibaculum bacchi]|uniref:universal stress protein n=1 Tax=Alkalibaculum bacchi TaxID=645887 RepID=UPI0026ED07B5|nr:universal stress protein [Alkalibaculum bacchi]
MKNIAIPIDGSDGSKKAMAKAKEFARVFGSNITLLNVKEIPVQEDYYNKIEDYLALLNEMSQKVLNEGKKFFSDLECNINTVSLEGNAARSIVKYVENNDIDLVIIGSEGLNSNGIKRVLIGSVANKVLHRLKKPLLIVK